jgi:hypothetical protein
MKTRSQNIKNEIINENEIINIICENENIIEDIEENMTLEEKFILDVKNDFSSFIPTSISLKKSTKKWHKLCAKRTKLNLRISKKNLKRKELNFKHNQIQNKIRRTMYFKYGPVITNKYLKMITAFR